jgi:Ca2+-binding EF-hand superfamily protein
MLGTERWKLLVGLAVSCELALAVGCGRQNPAPVATPAVKPTVTAVSTTPPVAAPTAASENDAETTPAADVASSPAFEKTDVEPAVNGGDQAAETAAPSAPPVSKERIVLLAPGNPIIIDFELSIDGQPHTMALERLVDEVLKLADTDGDGRTMWKELCASRRIKYGQYGNLAIDNENGEKQVIDRYDIARDGVVDRTELPRFLTRNAGASRSFSIRGTLDHRDLNRRGAPTWRVIDADDNGVISAEERAAAQARLASRDNDDDEVLLVSDLNPRLLTPDAEMMTERRRRGPDAARLLGPHADWTSVQRALEQEYGGGRLLGAGSFPLTPELFAQLDKNEDGRIRRDEFPALNDVPPHVVIAAEFGKRPGTGDGEHGTEEENGAPASRANQPRLKLIHIDPALAGSGSQVVEQPGRLTIQVGSTLLTFYTNDTVASDDFSARAKQALDMFDQNKDGYLEKSEVPESLQGQLGRFEAVDADDDGKAYPHEIEAFLAQQQAGLRAQIHAKATDSEDVLFAALDADHDERLDGRELQGAAQRLAALDKNGDGQVTPDELPEVLLIGLARGSLENADATFRPPPVIARGPDSKAPRWFAAMDANRDGGISRREFVGSAEKFTELDKDGNGLLEVGELISTSEAN